MTDMTDKNRNPSRVYAGTLGSVNTSRVHAREIRKPCVISVIRHVKVKHEDHHRKVQHRRGGVTDIALLTTEIFGVSGNSGKNAGGNGRKRKSGVGMSYLCTDNEGAAA